MSPIGVWKARVADEKSRDIFFVAMARTLGIPARIDKVTGKVQYTDKEGHTFDVNFSTSSPVPAYCVLLINLLPHCPIRSIILILRFPSSKTGYSNC